MRWVNKLSDTDIENLVKKLGVEYVNLRIEKGVNCINTNCIKIYLDSAYYYSLVIYDFSIMFSDDNGDYWECYDCIAKDKILCLFMENKFGREYLIDLIRKKTGLSGKFLRKKLR